MQRKNIKTITVTEHAKKNMDEVECKCSLDLCYNKSYMKALKFATLSTKFMLLHPYFTVYGRHVSVKPFPNQATAFNSPPQACWWYCV